MLTVAILSILAGVGLSQRFGAFILLPVSLVGTIVVVVFAIASHSSISTILAAVFIAVISVNLGYFLGVFHHAFIRSLLRRRHILRGSWSPR
jgi:hypothetical protein